MAEADTMDGSLLLLTVLSARFRPELLLARSTSMRTLLISMTGCMDTCFLESAGNVSDGFTCSVRDFGSLPRPEITIGGNFTSSSLLYTGSSLLNYWPFVFSA